MAVLVESVVCVLAFIAIFTVSFYYRDYIVKQHRWKRNYLHDLMFFVQYTCSFIFSVIFVLFGIPVMYNRLVLNKPSLEMEVTLITCSLVNIGIFCYRYRVYSEQEKVETILQRIFMHYSQYNMSKESMELLVQLLKDQNKQAEAAVVLLLCLGLIYVLYENYTPGLSDSYIHWLMVTVCILFGLRSLCNWIEWTFYSTLEEDPKEKEKRIQTTSLSASTHVKGCPPHQCCCPMGIAPTMIVVTSSFKKKMDPWLLLLETRCLWVLPYFYYWTHFQLPERADWYIQIYVLLFPIFFPQLNSLFHPEPKTVFPISLQMYMTTNASEEILGSDDEKEFEDANPAPSPPPPPAAASTSRRHRFYGEYSPPRPRLNRRPLRPQPPPPPQSSVQLMDGDLLSFGDVDTKVEEDKKIHQVFTDMTLESSPPPAAAAAWREDEWATLTQVPLTSTENT